MKRVRVHHAAWRRGGAWPRAGGAQKPAMPVIGFVQCGDHPIRPLAAAFREGLNEAGYVESQNVTVEYHWT